MKYLIPIALLFAGCGGEIESRHSIEKSAQPIQSVGLESVLAGDTIQLEATAAGCFERREIQLTNDTTDVVELRRASLGANSGAAFLQSYLRGGGERTLRPGEAANVLVDIYEEQAGLTTGALALDLRVDGVPQAEVLNLALATQPLEPVTDSFVQKDTQAADLLIAVSRQPSMRRLSEATRANTIALLEYLPWTGQRIRVGFIAMDSVDGELLTIGQEGATFVDLDFKLDAAALFDSLDLSPRPGANVRGLDAVGQVVLREEFFRAEPHMSIVFVADQDDTSEQTIDAFFNQLRARRDTRSFSVAAIVPFNDCAPTAPRFIELANISGGVFQSICTPDWSRSLEMRTFSFGFKSRFFLSQQADAGQLTLNTPKGPLPAAATGGTVNWSYVPALRSIDFTPFAVPAPNTPFSVTYTPACPYLLDARP